MYQLATAQKTSTAKLPSFVKNVKTRAKINETKITSRNVSNLDIFPLGGEEGSKYYERTLLFLSSLQKL